MTATIRNFVRGIRWFDVVFVFVFVVAMWMSVRLIAEAPPYPPTRDLAYGAPIVLVLAGAVFVAARLKPPSRRERASSRPAAGDPTPGEPASGKSREPETGEKS